MAAHLTQEEIGSIDAFSIPNIMDPMANQLEFNTTQLAAPLVQKEISSINAFSIPNVRVPKANQFDFITRRLAAPLTQEEISSIDATRAEITQLMINSLSPQPAKMTPEYIYWALQQVVEPLPGVFVPIYMAAAPVSEEEIAFMNAKMAEFAPLNAQIITERFDTQTITAQFKKYPQQTIEPQWYLSGAQRPVFDCYGNPLESYQCSDGEWRVLAGEDLENARRRTANLQAPVKAPIPRRRARRTSVANGQSSEASKQTAHTQ